MRVAGGSVDIKSLTRSGIVLRGPTDWQFLQLFRFVQTLVLVLVLVRAIAIAIAMVLVSSIAAFVVGFAIAHFPCFLGRFFPLCVAGGSVDIKRLARSGIVLRGPTDWQFLWLFRFSRSHLLSDFLGLFFDAFQR